MRFKLWVFLWQNSTDLTSCLSLSASKVCYKDQTRSVMPLQHTFPVGILIFISTLIIIVLIEEFSFGQKTTPTDCALYSGFRYRNNYFLDKEVICKAHLAVEISCQWGLQSKPISSNNLRDTHEHKDRIFTRSSFVLCKYIKYSRLTHTSQCLFMILTVNVSSFTIFSN